MPAGHGRGRLRPVAGLVAIAALWTTSLSVQASEHTQPVVAEVAPARVGKAEPLAVIDRGDIELSGAANVHDLLMSRSAFNSFGLHRPLVLGNAHAVFLVDGRRIPNPAASYVLEFLPVSAVERIEITSAGAAVRHAGNAIAGAINIMLRRDYDGTEVQATIERPGSAGGETEQGNAVWGGDIGHGHFVAGVDALRRGEIRSADRDYSRASWTPGSAFAETSGVSVGGNTLFVGTDDGLLARPLGACTGHGYTGGLTEPGGYGGTGCGFAYADIAWETQRLERQSLFAHFDLPINGAADLYIDMRVAQGATAFRFAPSVGTFSFTPSDELGRQLLDDPGIDEVPQTLRVAHRFLSHGNRDWNWDLRERDIAFGLRGRMQADIGYHAHIRLYRHDGTERGDTFVSESEIQRAIDEGRYDLRNPLSTAPEHRSAVRESGLRLLRDQVFERRTARAALNGTAFALGGGDLSWTAGAEIDYEEQSDVRDYLDVSGNAHDADDVLGSGGTSYVGKRQRRSGFAEARLPLQSDWLVALGTRRDDFDDVGATSAHRVSSDYRFNRFVTVRGSWDVGSRPPGLSDLHASSTIYYPYICDTKAFTGELADCDRSQVETASGGNPALMPDESQAFSVGVKVGPNAMTVSADWFRIELSETAAQLVTQTIVDLDAQGQPLPPGARVVREGDLITRIENPVVNSGEETVSGLDIRTHAEWKAAWADTGIDLRWLHLVGHEARVGGELQPGDRPRNRVHAALHASRGGITASWSIHAVSGYWNVLRTGRYKAWLGHDITVLWRDPYGLEGMTLGAGVHNVANRGPSVDPTDPGAADVRLDSIRGRTVFASARMSW